MRYACIALLVGLLMTAAAAVGESPVVHRDTCGFVNDQGVSKYLITVGSRVVMLIIGDAWSLDPIALVYWSDAEDPPRVARLKVERLDSGEEYIRTIEQAIRDRHARRLREIEDLCRRGGCGP